MPSNASPDVAEIVAASSLLSAAAALEAATSAASPVPVEPLLSVESSSTTTETIPMPTTPPKTTLTQTKSELVDVNPSTVDATSSNNKIQSERPTLPQRHIDDSVISPSVQQPVIQYSAESIAKMLAERDGQNIQFIPCMCPITISSMQQLSATTAPPKTTAAPKQSNDIERTEASAQPID